MAQQIGSFALTPPKRRWVIGALIGAALVPQIIVLALVFKDSSDAATAGLSIVLVSVVLVSAFIFFLLKGLFEIKTLELRGDTVSLRIAWWLKKSLSRSDVLIDQIRLGTLSTMPELTPRFRRLGVGIPATLHAGSFSLRNKSKAFCCVTDNQSLIYIPFKNDQALLLSIEDAQALRDILIGQ